MRRVGRILLNAATAVSYLLCVATLVVWAKSRSRYPSISWASGVRAGGQATGIRTFHVTARKGTLWFVRTDGWLNVPGARRAATGPARAARPVVVDPNWQDVGGMCEVESRAAANWFAYYSTKGHDPARAKEAAARADRLKTALHDMAVKKAGGPPAEPVLADKAPVVRQTLGLTFERGEVAFPRTADDGLIVYGPPVSFEATGMPLWMLIAVSALVPAARVGGFAVRRARGRSNRLRGLCPACGYDLRATPDRCPECGSIPAR